MKENRLEKAKKAYLKKGWKGSEAAFKPSEVIELIENSGHNIAEAVTDALFAAFMIGYNKGLRDAKKAATKESKAA